MYRTRSCHTITAPFAVMNMNFVVQNGKFNFHYYSYGWGGMICPASPHTIRTNCKCTPRARMQICSDNFTGEICGNTFSMLFCVGVCVCVCEFIWNGICGTFFLESYKCNWLKHSITTIEFNLIYFSSQFRFIFFQLLTKTVKSTAKMLTSRSFERE